ncbi:MAG: hypothetical protein KKA64_04805 [Nanoarchaeota archaeon]|nr:hypothetical protein [Nanoarchaeota archaeon]
MAKSRDEVLNILFWVLIWLGILILLVWIALKVSGIINSPVWFETLPYMGIVLTILGAAYQLGKIKQGIEETERKVNKLLSIEQRFSTMSHEHEIAMGRIKMKKH